MENPMADPDYWCKNELIYDRDWPAWLVASLLGEPDRVYSSDTLGYQVMLFHVSRVMAAERNEAYRAHRADCERLRRDSARRHDEAMTFADNWSAQFQAIDLSQLLEKGTKQERQRLRDNKTALSRNSILVGIVLREVIDLPNLLAQIDRDEYEARQLLTIRAVDAVASAYPALAEACRFRKAKLQRELRRYHRRYGLRTAAVS
jgi:hypothetical protein